jgi:hypothetical protein
MDQATQQNAALVQESAAAAESLKGQAQQLVEAVAVFKINLGEMATPAAAANRGGGGTHRRAQESRIRAALLSKNGARRTQRTGETG